MEYVINIDKFKREESIRFLKHLDEDKVCVEQELNQLANILGDYPLALAQAFTYISTAPNINVEKYMQLYKSRKNDLLDVELQMVRLSQGSYMDKYNKTIKVVMSLSIDEIKKASKDAYNLLGLISVLNPKNISQSIIYKYFDNDEIKVGEGLSHLLRYSILAKRNKDIKNADDVLYTIHDLTQATIRNSFTTEEINFFLKEASRSISLLLPRELDDYSGIFTDKYYLVDHINFTTALSKELGTYNEMLFQVNLKHLGYVLWHKRDYMYAKTMLDELKDKATCLVREKDLHRAKLLLLEATYYSWADADYKKSIQYALDAEKLLKDYKFTYENIIKCWRLAQDYSMAGDVDNMMPYINESEEVLSKTDIKAYTHRLPIEQCRTIMYMDQGDLEKALESVQKRKAINALQKPGISQGIGKIYILKDQARILFKKGEYKLLKEIADEITDILGLYYKKDTCLTPIPHIIMAYYYLQNDSLSKAEKEINHSLKLYNVTLKIGGVLKAISYKIQGDIFYRQKKYSKALASYLETEKIYNSIFVNKKISDVSELYEALVNVNIKLLEPLQAYHYRDKHLETFGVTDETSMRLWHKVAEAENPSRKI